MSLKRILLWALAGLSLPILAQALVEVDHEARELRVNRKLEPANVARLETKLSKFDLEQLCSTSIPTLVEAVGKAKNEDERTELLRTLRNPDQSLAVMTLSPYLDATEALERAQRQHSGYVVRGLESQTLVELSARLGWRALSRTLGVESVVLGWKKNVREALAKNPRQEEFVLEVSEWDLLCDLFQRRVSMDLDLRTKEEDRTLVRRVLSVELLNRLVQKLRPLLSSEPRDVWLEYREIYNALILEEALNQSGAGDSINEAGLNRVLKSLFGSDHRPRVGWGLESLERDTSDRIAQKIEYRKFVHVSPEGFLWTFKGEEL